MDAEDSDIVTTVGPDGNPSPQRFHRFSEGTPPTYPQVKRMSGTPETSNRQDMSSETSGNAPSLSAANLVGLLAPSTGSPAATPAQVAEIVEEASNVDTTVVYPRQSVVDRLVAQSPLLDASQPAQSVSPALRASRGSSLPPYTERREFLTKDTMAQSSSMSSDEHVESKLPASPPLQTTRAMSPGKHNAAAQEAEQLYRVHVELVSSERRGRIDSPQVCPLRRNLLPSNLQFRPWMLACT